MIASWEVDKIPIAKSNIRISMQLPVKAVAKR
jgi:hypothetical protein